MSQHSLKSSTSKVQTNPKKNYSNSSLVWLFILEHASLLSQDQFVCKQAPICHTKSWLDRCWTDLVVLVEILVNCMSKFLLHSNLIDARKKRPSLVIYSALDEFCLGSHRIPQICQLQPWTSCECHPQELELRSHT
jgi:hypothetical protein